MRPRPEDLGDMAVFAAVARLGGFTAAARELDLSKSLASKAVARLEARLATRLLQRTTRRLALTEAGQTLLARAARMVEEAAAGAEAVSALAGRPLGTLRVNGPVVFGETVIAPALPALLAQHPGLRVELTLEDRVVDAAAGGWDVVVRIGPLADSTLVARKLARQRVVVVAAPTYLDRRGTPRHPADLGAHALLRYALVPAEREWRFRGLRAAPAPTGSAPLVTNDGLALRAAARGGLGIAVLPHFMIAEDLRAGTLVELLSAHTLPTQTFVHALHAPGRPVPAKVRAFVDHLAAAVRAAGLEAA